MAPCTLPASAPPRTGGAPHAAACSPPRPRSAHSPSPRPRPPAQVPPSCATDGAIGLAYAEGVNCRTVELDGHPRRFLVYVPQTAPPAGARRPVVFMFHGSSGAGEQFLGMSGWREQADATGLIAVFPTGLRYRVSRLRPPDDQVERLRPRREDRPAELPPGSDPDARRARRRRRLRRHDDGRPRARLPIDGRRIYASGFSNGADFTARLSIDRSDKLAAAAYSGGALPFAATPGRGRSRRSSPSAPDDPKIIEQVDPTLTRAPAGPGGHPHPRRSSPTSSGATT